MAQLHVRVDAAIPSFHKTLSIPSSLGTQNSPHPYTYPLSFYDGRVLGKSEPGFHVGVRGCEASHLLDGLIGVRVYKAVCTHVGLAFGQKPLLQHLRNGWIVP